MSPSDSHANLVDALGIDFGTTHTVAVLRWKDGRVRPLLFDNSPQLPSAVYAPPLGPLEVGSEALRLGARYPDRLEANPKQRIDEGTLLLGDREIAVKDAFAAVLNRVRLECQRVAALPSTVVMTVPATWGPSRRHLLTDAAGLAGLYSVNVIAEPVAAAAYYVHTLGQSLPDGNGVAVFDAGAGTFDATVVRRSPHGFDTLAMEGREDLGGLDLDDDLTSLLALQFRDYPEWLRLTSPATVEQQRLSRALSEEVRIAREQLSRAQQTELFIPGLDMETVVTRSELEQAIAPRIRRCVDITRSVIREAQPNLTGFAGVFLVGGTSRTPLASTTLHRQLGLAPTVLEQPEIVVAEGSLTAAMHAQPVTSPTGSSPLTPFISGGFSGNAFSPASSTPVVTPPPAPVTPPGPPKTPRGRTYVWAAAAAAAAVLLAGATTAVAIWPEGHSGAIGDNALAPAEDIVPDPIGHSDPTEPSESRYDEPGDIADLNFPDVLGHVEGAHDGEILSLNSLEHEELGTILLTGGDDGVIRSWDLDTGNEFGEFQRLEGAIESLRAFGGDSDQPHVWSQHAQNAWLWEWETHEFAPEEAWNAATENEPEALWAGEVGGTTQILTLDNHGDAPTIQVLDADTGDVVGEWDAPGLTYVADPIEVGGGKRFVGVMNQELVVLNLHSGSEIVAPMSLPGQPSLLQTGPQAEEPAAVVVSNDQLHFYDLENGEESAEPISLGDSEIETLHVGDSWGYPFVGTVDSDQQITMWSTESGSQIADYHQVEDLTNAHFTYIDGYPVVAVTHDDGSWSVVALSLI